MYKSMKNTLSNIFTITPLEKQAAIPDSVVPDSVVPSPTVPGLMESLDDEFDAELPLDFPDRTDSPATEHTYYYKNQETGHYREYYYLHNYPLHKEYTHSGEKTVNLCIFAINTSCHFQDEPRPFLQFVLQKQTFPSIMFRSAENVDGEQLQIQFQNDCFNAVLDFFVIEGSFDSDIEESMSTCYRGFIERGDGSLVAVYDMTNFMNLPFRTTKNPYWSVLSEIRLTESPVKQFFEKYKYMAQLQTSDYMNVAEPFLLYLYNIETGEYIQTSGQRSMIEPRSYYAPYGKFYYFVEQPPASGNPRKCVVFIENEYVDESVYPAGATTAVDQLPDDSSDDELILTESDNSSENSNEFEPVEPVTHSENYVSEPSEESVEESSDESVEQNESDTILQVYSNKLPFSSVILFEKDGVKMCCVKTESLFMELV
jgi:hypothetical protein